MKDFKRSMGTMKSKDELLTEDQWNELYVAERRVLLGCVGNSYVKFLADYFGSLRGGNSYSFYKRWHFLENTPLGQELK